MFVDGEWARNKLSYTKDLISEILEIPRGNINIKCGKDFDKFYPIVNIADELAHYLFRNCSLEELCQNPNRVKLLK